MTYDPYYEDGWKSGRDGGTPITPEALNYFDEKLAQAFSYLGFGYGGKMEYYDVQDNTFETVLDEILAGMDAYSAKQIQFCDTEGLCSDKFIGNLWKYTADYAALEAVSYSGLKAVKAKTGGTWQPWEWENPPMVLGTEYRTTERWQNNAVYVKAVDCGSLPNATLKAISTGIPASEDGEVVSFQVNVTSTSGGRHAMPLVSSDFTVQARAVILTSGVLQIKTSIDMSEYTAIAVIKYTKNSGTVSDSGGGVDG